MAITKAPMIRVPWRPWGGFAGALAVVAFTGGCDDKSGAEPSTSATASASAAPAASSAPVEAPPPAEVVGKGVEKFADLGQQKGCTVATKDFATYLKRGELTVAARGEEVAAAWLVQLPGKAQIGFAGFDAAAEKIARDRGIGDAREHAPRLFATKDRWMMAWFDPEGLAYARPTWEVNPGPEIHHLVAVKDVPAEDVGLAADPSGALIAVSPFGANGQLSLFQFAGVDASEGDVRAIGVTKHAKSPRRPAVAGDADGYTVVWLEDGDRVAATRFSLAGKELGAAHTVADPLADGGKRSGLALVSVKGGALAVWEQAGEILSRQLGSNAAPVSPIWRLGKGKWPDAAPLGPSAIIGWVGEKDGLVAVRVTDKGPTAEGVAVSKEGVVMDPPVVTTSSSLVGFAWTERMSAAISSKRAVLQLAPVSSCFP